MRRRPSPGRWPRLHRLRHAPAAGAERGETLIELIVTVAIMGTAVVAILGAIANSIMLTGTHRKQSVAGAAVRAYAETVETGVAAAPTKYAACASVAAYQTAFAYTPPTGYTRSVLSVEYVNSTNGFTGSCSTDLGVQRVTLQVASSDNKVKEKLVIVIRKPCRSTTDFPADPACT